jgi:hypothetical protein
MALPRSHWINTMLRCALAAFAAVVVASPASAQVQRNFPREALRGDLVVGVFPEAVLNGKPARFAPGARIFGLNNTFELPGTIAGRKAKVHYTVDPMGQLRDVWILRPDEAAKVPWPATREEAAQWQFDYIGQRWTKP